MPNLPVPSVRQPEPAERGQMLLVLTFLFVVIAAFVGLAADGAVLYWNRTELASRADAAALAGGGELPNAANATAKAYQYLSLHNVLTPTYTISVTVSQTRVPNDGVTVTVTRALPTAFIRLVGVTTMTVSASATALGSSWSAEQTYDMFRGGPARTGMQTCTSLDSGIDAVKYQWGHRWDIHDTDNHRSTPAIYGGDLSLHSGHYVAYVGSNGTSSEGTDAYSGVYAWDGTPGFGTDTSIYDTAGGYNDATGATYANTLRSLPGTANKGGLLWFQPLDRITGVRSSPLVYTIPGLNGDFPVVFVDAQNGKVYALDARDGDVLWQSANNNDEYNSDSGYRASSALVQEGNNYYLYAATSRGNAYKYNALTGAIIWRATPLPDPRVNSNVPSNWVTTTYVDGVGAAATNGGKYWGYSPIYGTPNVYNGVVYLTDHGKTVLNTTASNTCRTTSSCPPTAGNEPPYIYALNASTGAKLWLSSTDLNWENDGSENRMSATVANVDTDYDGTPDQVRVYGAPTDGYLYAYNGVTGVEIWHKYTGQHNHRSDPAFFCGVIFGGNGDGATMNSNGTWPTDAGGAWAMDAVYGNSIWDGTDDDGAGPDQANPEYLNDPGAYGPVVSTNKSGYGYLCPLFPSTTTRRCAVRMINGGVKSSPAVVNGLIIIGANCPYNTSSCNGGAVLAINARTGRNLGYYNTSSYNYTNGNGLGPTNPPSGTSNGDVRSGVVVGGDDNVYFGAQDGGLYQLYVTKLLLLIK